MTECPDCGTNLEGQEHSYSDCLKQQEVNKTNLRQDSRCRWCGVSTEMSTGDHREGCPRYKKDKSTVLHEGDTTIYRTECGYCGVVSEHKSTKSDKRGFGGGCSFGGAEHKYGCPKHVMMMNRAS